MPLSYELLVGTDFGLEVSRLCEVEPKLVHFRLTLLFVSIVNFVFLTSDRQLYFLGTLFELRLFLFELVWRLKFELVTQKLLQFCDKLHC